MDEITNTPINDNDNEKSEQAEITEEPANSADETEKKEVPALPPHKEYAKRMAKFGTYYTQLLSCIILAVAASVAVAIMQSLMIGVAMAILSAILYVYFTHDEMLKSLGLDYQSVEGGILIRHCKASYGNVMWIPSRLIWFDVISIGDNAFDSEANSELTRVFFPSTLKSIGKNIFDGCPLISEIYFEGSEELWNSIEKGTDFSSYKVIFDAKYPPIPKKKKKQRKAKKDKASDK